MELTQKDFTSEINDFLINSRNIYLVLTNRVGDFLFVNDHYKKTFLSSSRNLKEYSFEDITHPLDIAETKREMLTCFQKCESKPHQIINRNRVKNTKRYKSVRWECSCLKNRIDEEPLLMFVGYDLVAVENKSDYTSKTNKTLNDLIDDLQIGVVIQDVDSSILLSNTKAEELLGLSKAELYGRTVYDEEWKIIKPDGTIFPPEELPVPQAIRTKKYIRDEIMGVYNPKSDRFFWFQVDANPDLDENNNVERVVTTFIDITERVKAEDAIKKQQQQLQTMMDHAPMVIFMKNVEGKYLFFNRLYQDFLNTDLEPGITDYDIFDKDFSDWSNKKDIEVIENNRIIDFEHHVGDQVFHETKFPIKDEEGNIYAIGGFSQNITKQKEEEELLRLLESVITSTKDAVLITEAEPIDKPGPKIVYANQAFYDITGYSEEEVIGNNPRFLQGENTDRRELDKLRKALDNWETCEVQLVNYKKNGEEFWVNFRVVPVANKEGVFTHWISVQQNITQRVRQEKVLKDALKEKTTLLAEIHHRVKNNLAIVSGLLELQSMDLEGDSAMSLKRSINRIQSIAMVHELMYETEQLSSINIKSYLDELIPGIYQTMRLKEDVIFNIDLEDYEININQAIPLGLLMNELLTNSFKYAFLKTFDGQINISMRSDGDTLKFIYADNGPGFKEGESFTNSSTSLGLSLIHAQLEQLHADYEVITDGYFELSFTFDISRRGPHSNI